MGRKCAFFIFSFIFVCFLSVLPVHAEKLSDDSARFYTSSPDSQIYIAYLSEDVSYVTDSDKNIIGGPYKLVSIYEGYTYAEEYDGSHILYDHDGSIIASAAPEGEIIPPCNGIFAVMPDTKDVNECEKFIIYDYETKEELCTLNGYIFIYNETQTDRMFVKSNGKFAVVDKFGNFYTDYIYDEVVRRFNPPQTPYPDSYAIVKQDGNEIYIDNDMRIIDVEKENFITDYLPTYTENLHIAVSKNSFGIYDELQSRFVLPLQDEYSIAMVKDNTAVISKDNKYSLLNISENIIMTDKYENIQTSDNLCLLYTKLLNDNTYQYGILDWESGAEVFKTDLSANIVPAADGTLILSHSDDSDYSASINTCAVILNYAGHNLTGEIYSSAGYENGQFLTSDNYYNPPSDPIDIDLGFAVVNVNGEYTDTDGVIVNDRTMLPVRDITEALGGTVDWDGENRNIHILLDNKSITFSIDSDTMTINGENIALDVPAQLINDKAMLPVRALADAIDAKIDWKPQYKGVYITK